MSKKAIVIAGIPGTGKTTLMKEIIKRLGGLEAFERKEHGLVKYLKHKTIFLIILGVYDNLDEVFLGTDKFSMAVQPDFEPFLKTLDGTIETVLFEGDRLLIGATFDSLFAHDYDVQVRITTANDKLLKKRYADRGSNQDKQFIESRATKVARISVRLDLMGCVEEMPNETPEQLQKNVEEVLSLI